MGCVHEIKYGKIVERIKLRKNIYSNRWSHDTRKSLKNQIITFSEKKKQVQFLGKGLSHKKSA